MKLIAICGSARKQGNTANMLQQVVEGAGSAGAEAELVDYGGTATGPRPKDFKTALVATMNVKDDIYVERGCRDTLTTFVNIMGDTLGSLQRARDLGVRLIQS